MHRCVGADNLLRTWSDIGIETVRIGVVMSDQLYVVELVFVFCLVVCCNESDDVPFSIKHFNEVTLEEKNVLRVGSCDIFFSKVFDVCELLHTLQHNLSIINFKQFHLLSVYKEDRVVGGAG